MEKTEVEREKAVNLQGSRFTEIIKHCPVFERILLIPYGFASDFHK
jgi:hypothetical protein